MSSANSLKAQFDFQTRLFNNVTEGISDSESQIRQTGNSNNIKWVAGHILHYRLSTMSKLTGLQPDESYGIQFGRGAMLDPNISYPSFDEITSRWKASAQAISENISKIPEEVLATTAMVQSPIFNIDNTNLGFVIFLFTHEATHIGQIGLMRKMIGKEAMSFR